MHPFPAIGLNLLVFEANHGRDNSVATEHPDRCGYMTPTLPPLVDVLDLMPDAVCVVDVGGHLLFVNASFQRIFGYAPGEMLGRPIFDLVHPDDLAATTAQAEAVMAGNLQRHFRNRYLHKDGHTVDIQWSARWLPEHGVRIGVGREVTELRRLERELEHRANHDSLTGLANRDRLRVDLQSAIRHAIQHDHNVALLYLDLDGFKFVNDRGGHAAGDHLLREVAVRLQQGIRTGDVLARVGGDEFVALLPGCRDTDAAQSIADALRARLAQPFKLGNSLFQLDASIGIACFPTDGTDAEALLTHADRAMYAAKRQRSLRAVDKPGPRTPVHDIGRYCPG
ncbi:MAG TPA: sensor domain-containing diguanylate cyclase [Rhodanobacter sp.]|nr:sensor domain-containing diguanylate cyclase [Rhodanobacter sp.]